MEVGMYAQRITKVGKLYEMMERGAQCMSSGRPQATGHRAHTKEEHSSRWRDGIVRDFPLGQ